MNKLVSIVIPCFKAGAYINKALESIASQTYTNWEIIAIDDCGPKDDTELLVREFARKYDSKRVVFIKHEKNKGVSAARNTGVKNAKGNLIALLDPDDFWKPKHLEQGIYHFNNDRALSFYSSFANIFYDNNSSQISDIEGYKDWELKAFPSILSIRNAIPNSSAIIRAEVFDQIGLYDESIDMQHVEDCDLWIRIVSGGLKALINPEPNIYYRKHASGATSNSDKMNKAKHVFALKHKDWMVLHLRRALDAQVRHIFTLENKIEQLKRYDYDLVARLNSVEQTIKKFKTLPILKQLLQLKRQF
ncbi:glycosyltransferase [Mangrovimonas sp. AS39]|uniref:glycosyltransferase family 2 protein n=1 Tax=Mangrovimonas futianensis TaxID=2895523 RepID=UPI001E3D1B48|nr:glycosyltransferase family 2 protein [Mangrovimonas futianensis]MCF1190818.1 glycosyltransferase [Mangrovimonas futianensis]MCF1194515.1 glycosyltransferase [Mangrovimonas futianensis]